ncbi:MAG: flavin-dependent dehydrogenase [Bacteroidia bacterium]
MTLKNVAIMPDKNVDVVIIGGGLAGLTLALQLKLAKQDIRLVVLEKRTDIAPNTAFKIGESSSELGSIYLLDKLNLKQDLDAKHLTKIGTRFFVKSEDKPGIAQRVEIGPEIVKLQQTMHVDRGVLENQLVELVQERGIDLILGAKVTDASIGNKSHSITYTNNREQITIQSTWVVDSSGRNGVLKKTLGLTKILDHTVNAVWFRLDGVIDIDNWLKNNLWMKHLENRKRRLSTNHLMGKGYWIWIIPLKNGKTSIGIVADPNFHPFDDFNTLEKAKSWFALNEPLASEEFSKHHDSILDFKVMKSFSHDCKQFYSSKGWALTGDAGAFLDPLYSPGLDFIGLGNTWITDLVTRDLNAEKIDLRSLVYELTHRELLNGWSKVYKGMYGLLGKPQIMVMKTAWDWATYWAIPNVMFVNDGYIDLDIIREYSDAEDGLGSRFALINEVTQQLFRAWSDSEFSGDDKTYFNLFDLQCLYDFQTNLNDTFSGKELTQKIKSNLSILEQMSAEMFKYALNHKHNNAFLNMETNPYTMTLTDSPYELIEKSKRPNKIKVTTQMKQDVAKLWFTSTRIVSV